MERTAPDEFIVTSDLCGRKEATDIRTKSNRETGTIAAPTIYPTEEVAPVNCATATDDVKTTPDGILK